MKEAFTSYSAKTVFRTELLVHLGPKIQDKLPNYLNALNSFDQFKQNDYVPYVTSEYAGILFIMYVGKFLTSFEGGLFQRNFSICVSTTFCRQV